MSWQYTPYTIGLLIAAAFSLVIVAHGVKALFQNGLDPAVVSFTVVVVGVTLWSVSYAFQLASVDSSAKLAWRVIGYVGHNLVPIGLFVFCLLHTGYYERWLTRRTVALLAVEPLIVGLVVAPTNPFHSLLWADFSVVSVGSVRVLDPVFGPWYWVNTAYNYALVAGTVGILASMLVRAPDRQYRRQAEILLIGIGPALVANVAWVAGLTRFDHTPAALAMLVLALGTAIYRFQLIDLVPIARSTVVQKMRDGYVVLDANDRIVDANPTAMTVFGRSNLVGKLATNALPDELHSLVERTSENETELIIENREGRQYYNARITTLANDAVSGRLLSLRNVTDRRDIERRFRLLIEHSTDVVTVIGRDLEFTYASPSANRVSGYESEDLIGENVLSMIHPDDRERIAAAFERDAATVDSPISIEYRFRRRDGTWGWFETSARNLLSDPTIQGIVCNSREITDRKRRERDLERQNERLDEFASVVSHDLRNPLNVVDGYLDLARETGDDAHFEAIERATGRMYSIIDDVLTLARQGQVIDQPGTVALDRVVTDAWETVETGDATLAFGDGIGNVTADRTRLQELFENLFRNAIEHAGTDPTVKISTAGNSVYIDDDGPGIPDEHNGTVFEHGYTTANDGTGFGLAIVRTIAEAHGWTVRATDSPAGGARFEIGDLSRSTAIAATAND